MFVSIFHFLTTGTTHFSKNVSTNSPFKVQKRLVIVSCGQRRTVHQEILGEEAKRLIEEDGYHLVARRKNKLDRKRYKFLKISNEVFFFCGLC